jgi:hypothetical protein
VFVTIDLDFLAGILSEQDRVASLDVKGDARSVVFDLAVAGRDDFALLGLLFGGIRDDDAADLLLAFLDPLDDDAVVQWSDLHGALRGR